jgi:precorrin-6A/cobalt-precorrin-6A reductase
MHVLILGGAGEARELAAALAERTELRVTLSLAGRTRVPALPDCDSRIGGFGGAEGLADWLRSHDVDVLVDATHPFARVISGNAVRAAAAVGLPLIVVERPPWEAVAGDRWTRVGDMDGAVAALGNAPKRVFLAVGRQEIAVFRAAPQHHYVVRSIELPAPETMPPVAEAILARGPFATADDQMLLVAHGVDIVVAKNSGGQATYGKIAAARTLGLPVVIVDRQPRAGAAATVGEALDRLDQLEISPNRGV